MLIINRMLSCAGVVASGVSVFLAACTVHFIGPPLSNFWGPSSGNNVAPQKLQAPCIQSNFWPQYGSKKRLWGPYFHLPLEKIRHTSLKQSHASSPKQLMGSTPWQHAYKRLTDEGWSLWARFDQPVIGRSWLWVYSIWSVLNLIHFLLVQQNAETNEGEQQSCCESSQQGYCAVKIELSCWTWLLLAVLASKTFAGHCVIKAKGVTLCWQRQAVLFLHVPAFLIVMMALQNFTVITDAKLWTANAINLLW